ncbi:MAG: cobalt-precorrin-6A reductase [Acetobacter syzygii]|uniref:cobalt-precorrin-6A reductase n=1 Tax=Acetobacter syzygii TaxID=146476 RepID=UPI0039E93695
MLPAHPPFPQVPQGPATRLRVLVLGGTTEASSLCTTLAHTPAIHAILSLAGATSKPHLPSITTRIGGFGGADGLTRWLRQNGIMAVIDATHPFAAQMSHHAMMACKEADIPLLRLERPEWQATPQDQWLMVKNITEAATELAYASRWNTSPQSVFLTTGRKETRPFLVAPQHHYLFRSIEQPATADLPPDTTVLLARGPFDLADEHKLMLEQKITVLVTKNSGGTATGAKLEAARMLGIPVIMVSRPPQHNTPRAKDAAAALAWLNHLASSTLRAV